MVERGNKSFNLYSPQGRKGLEKSPHGVEPGGPIGSEAKPEKSNRAREREDLARSHDGSHPRSQNPLEAGQVGTREQSLPNSPPPHP